MGCSPVDMDGIRRSITNNAEKLKMGSHGVDLDMFKSSVVLHIRKMSRATILFAVLSFSFAILYISFPDYHPGLQEYARPSNNQTSPLHSGSQHQTGSTAVEGQGLTSETVEKQLRDRRFALVIPATSASPDLCKTIFTALALDYPSPVIINWDIDYHAITKWEGGRNLPKIPGFVKYLDAVLHPDAHPDEKLEDDDIVLMVDAYDVWFQLPAEVFLKRYHEINEQANARLLKQWKGEGPMPMRQTIIAASGKNCHPQPKSGSNLHCDQLPESPLSPDLYGPGAEKNETKIRDHRPRYINGGVYIGPAGDMRRLFRRAMEKMEAGIGQGVHLFSEQGIPGEVLGEQEVWRKWRRESDVSSEDAAALMERDFEYHFGLDYYQTLSVQTFWTDNEEGLFDGGFVTLNNRTEIDEKSAALGISPVRLKGVPEDVKATQNPLAKMVEGADWGEMSLYADFFTESVPAIVHHNGFKDRRTNWWEKPWFQPFLRQLVNSRLAPPRSTTPLATIEDERGTVRYWPPLAEDSNRRPRLMVDSAITRLAQMEFGDLCHFPDTSPIHWWEENTKKDLRYFSLGIVIKKPPDKLGNPALYLSFGLVPEHAFGFCNICESDGHVARLRLTPVDDCCLTEALLYQTNQLTERNCLRLAEIEHLEVGARVAQRSTNSLNDVVDVCVIASRGPVAKHRDWPAVVNELRKLVNRQVRTLTRTVDGEESEANAADVVEVWHKSSAACLDAAYGEIGCEVLQSSENGTVALRPYTLEEDPNRNWLTPKSFAHSNRFKVPVTILQRRADAGTCGQMHDGIEFVVGEHFAQGLGLSNVNLVQPEVGVREVGGNIVVVEVVDDNNKPGAFCQKGLDEVRADEARTTSDQHCAAR
ncbi:hypothetical protein HJFPF1_08512 [Paramyrothecium foliicola]|nr:hypothetical protein HJFPF1_08512 [Paramyrothecium foliicola]